MKAIMISIRPEWVEKILKGEKTIEIRKSYPKCELPCKVYIYCIKGKNLWMHNKETIILGSTSLTSYLLNGTVVAEFTLNKITKHEKNYIDVEDRLCYNFTREDVKKAGFIPNRVNGLGELKGLIDFDYFVSVYGKGEPLYAWYIDDLKIYDTPKELCEFSKHGFESLYGSSVCGNSSCPFYLDSNTYDLPPECLREEQCQIIRPPQSWCYVEVQDDRKR